MWIKSNHRGIVGSVDGKSFEVEFDDNGEAEVEEGVGEYLLRLQSAVKIEKEPPKDPNAPIPVEKMKVEELKKYAEDNQIDLGDAKNKGEILAKIQEFEASKSAGDPQ